MAIDTKATVVFSNNVEVINATPHEIVFIDNGQEVIVQPCGATLLATTVETHVDTVGRAELVKTVFQKSAQGEEELRYLHGNLGRPVLIIASIVSAQAYAGENVVGMIPLPGYERKPPAEKRYDTTKFNVF